MNAFNFFFLVLIVSLLGADKLSLSFFGVNLKPVFIFLSVSGVVFLLKRKILFSFPELFFLFLIVLGGTLSLLNSSKTHVGIFYNIWVVFNFFFVYGFFKVISEQYGFENIKKIYIYSFRFQIVFCLLLFPFFHTYDYRYSFFYYEPSYFSIASIPYLGFVFHDFFNKKFNLKDLFFILALLLITKSAVLILILILIFTMFFIFYKGIYLKSKIKIISTGFFIGVFSLFILYFISPDNLISVTLNNILESENKLEAIFSRMGNRIPRIQLVWAFICDYFPGGVGGGNYRFVNKDYISLIDYSSLIDYKSQKGFSISIDVFNPIGLPAINVFLEALAEMGVIGGTGFIGFCLYIFFLLLRDFSRGSNSVLFIIIFVFFVTLSIESSYLKLSLWAFMGCISGIISNEKKRCI
ncbi:MAG: hypothetical protein ACSHXJ_00665 [Marinomonas colpomeniae]